MDKIVLFTDKKDCCACGGCVNICPNDAISMKEDEFGFLYPEIDHEKCIQLYTGKTVIVANTQGHFAQEI